MKKPINPTLPNVSFFLGGATYYLCFDFNALCTAEELTGINLLTQVFDLSSMSAKTFRAVLYAALLCMHPDISIEQVGLLVQPGTMELIYPALVSAWFASMPKQDKKPKNAEEPGA